jgi:hypothetical protein
LVVASLSLFHPVAAGDWAARSDKNHIKTFSCPSSFLLTLAAVSDETKFEGFGALFALVSKNSHLTMGKAKTPNSNNFTFEYSALYIRCR